MTSDRKKPTAGFWTTVALVVVLVAYPVSFGPYCWIIGRPTGDDEPRERPAAFYYPIIWTWWHGPPRLALWINEYADLWSSAPYGVSMDDDGSLALIDLTH